MLFSSLQTTWHIVSADAPSSKGWMVDRSAWVKSDSEQPLSSAIFTAAPDRWCVSLKGTPATVLARSVWAQKVSSSELVNAKHTFPHQVLGQVCCKHVCAEA